MSVTKGDPLAVHLQYAVDLELWTIPFYLSAMYSIRDPSCAAYQLLQSVVFQEMLHLQLASNVANALGVTPTFAMPVYRDQEIPHLDFHLDHPDPREQFSPFSAEIGPLDEARVNAMCLVEYPEWGGRSPPSELRADRREYGSIGEMYDALEAAIAAQPERIRGNIRQVDLFGRFYAGGPRFVVSADGEAGLAQVRTLIDVIREQGEGRRKVESIRKAFRNTADDPWPDLPHFEKFEKVRGAALPDTWPATTAPGPAGQRALLAQDASFQALLDCLGRLFGGGDATDFPVVMATAGAAIGNCWRSGAVPRFSSPGASK